jgi:DNA-binding transcriptional LysR family regulator
VDHAVGRGRPAAQAVQIVERSAVDLGPGRPDRLGRLVRPGQPRAALLEGRVDAAVARLPFATDQLDVTILYDEPRELLVPADHRLAGKESVTLDDIAGEPVPRMPDPAWNAFWRIDPRPDGSPAPDGPLVDDMEDKLELIAAGEAVAIIPGGLQAANLRPDLTTIPLEGVDPSHIVIATRADDRNRLLADFRKCARAHRASPAAGGLATPGAR